MRSHFNEKAELHITTKSGLHPPQLEKGHEKQQRPSIAKHFKNKINYLIQKIVVIPYQFTSKS